MSPETLTRPRARLDHEARRAPIVALAGVEAMRMVRHPAFLLGLAVTLLTCLLGTGQESWAGQTYYLHTVAWTFTWMGMLLAAALVAGRQRFLSDPDLFPATPVTGRDRVLATALGLVGPTVVAALAAALVALSNIRDGGYVLGDPGTSRAVVPPFAEWAQPVLLVALAGVVGIAVAQLRRGRLAVLGLLLFATFVGGEAVWMFQAHPVRVLHPFMYPSYETKLAASYTPEGWGAGDPPLIAPGEFNSTWRAQQFDTAALGWHLPYVVGLILLGVWWAMRTADRRERAPARWLVAVGATLVLLGGTAQILTAGVNP